MQLGRCCKCGKTICEGYWLRNCVIESVTLSDTGLEEVAWTHITTNLETPPQSGVDYYRINDNGAPWEIGTKKLTYGVRYNTFMPTANNQQWYQNLNAQTSSSLTPSQIPNFNVFLYYPFVGGMVSSQYSNIGGYRPPNYNSENLIYPYSELVAYGCLRETCDTRNYATVKPVTQIVVPFGREYNTAAGWPLFGIRPLYFRFLADGEPVSDILSLVEPDNEKYFRPSSDVSKANWFGVGDTIKLYENIDTDNDDTDYNWCDAGTNTISHSLSGTDVALPFDKTGYKLIVRIARCSNDGTVMGSADSGNALDVTIQLKNITTVRASFTLTVPADITTYTLDLSDSQCVSINSLSNLRIDFITTDSGGSVDTRRGLAIFSAKFVTNANESISQYPFYPNYQYGGSHGNRPQAFNIAASQQQYSLKKGKKFGIDVWYELRKETDNTTVSQISIGDFRNGSAGTIGVKLEYAPSFSPEDHAFKLTYVGGKYRSWACLGDVQYLHAITGSSYSYLPGTQIIRRMKVNFTSCEIDGFYSQAANDTYSFTDGEDFTMLSWSSETPILQAINRLWVLEDTNGTGIRNWYDSTPNGPMSAQHYYLQNSPGSFWKINRHKFVPAFGLMTSSNDPFVDQNAGEFPDYILVEKVTKVEQIVVYTYRNTTGYNYANWATPAEELNVTEFVVECWGAGGGGAGAGYQPSPSLNPQGLPGSGGGGGYSRSVLSLLPSTVYRLYVGTGGAGGDVGVGGDPGNDGSDGEETSFRYGTDVLVSAAGGKKGYGAPIGSSGAGGIGGSAADGIGQIRYSGGNGISSTHIGPSPEISVGGGSAGWESDGNSAGPPDVSGTGGKPATVKHGGKVASYQYATNTVPVLGPGGGGPAYYNNTPGLLIVPHGCGGAVRITYFKPKSS